MKLYLATSSLNVDNILSTESVAPYSFYQVRNYGYDSFVCLDLIPFKNVLILFSRIPHFEIYDKEHDSRPLVLEIEVNESINPLVHIAEYKGVNVYSTDTIIRLSPFNTRLLFFKPQDLNHSRLSCSDSLTNKLGDRFCFDMCRADFNLAHLSKTNLHVDDKCDNFEQKVFQDNRLNTIKGFVFGYYLGVSKSVSANSAKLLKIQKRVYDIAATIKNNGGYSNNSFFNELEQLDKEYRRNDPNSLKCKDLWDKTLTELGIPSEALNQLLALYDVNGVVKTNFMKKQGVMPTVSLHQYGFNNIEMYRDNLKHYTDNIIREEQKIQLSSFDVMSTFDLDPSYETCMLAGEDSDSMIFNKFIDAILWHGIAPTPDTLRTDRFNIATEITKSAKSIWESTNQEWQNSSAQIFMNDLRQNIKSFTPLDINKQENEILKSIAAFVLKGEDLDAVVQFCEDNSYSDYRYALSLWGATIGYVKMSNPIISGLTKRPEFANIYKAIIALLYNVDSEGELPNIEEPIQITQKEESRPIFVPAKEELDKLRIWQESIRSFFEQLKKVPKKKDLYAPLESAFAENGNQMDYVKFFALLNDYKEWRTSKGEPIKAWKSMVEHFCPEEYSKRFGYSPESIHQNKKQPKKMFERSFDFWGFKQGEKFINGEYPETSSVSIITDENAANYLKACPKLVVYRTEIVDIFIEFQIKYQSGYYFKNQHQYNRNNNDVVDHFCKWCLSKKNPNAIPYTQDNKGMIDEIKKYLLIKYHD
ncbi:hypothetical protein [Prevotella denticola]|uniref:hypothetical protein n=1 Tax=Prevotella denticola TaxID=28129 RepID=UPI001C5EA3FD|nr:hypothetical protein [Prevotella denticola]MBW4760502.1 hypothetical protein [Prevotella denticola]